MITRTKLVELLRETQVRSQNKWVVLITVFSPKPRIATRLDVVVALSSAFLFSVLVASSYLTLYLRHFRIAAVIMFLGLLILTCLRFLRQRTIAKRRERRMLLPLSM